MSNTSSSEADKTPTPAGSQRERRPRLRQRRCRCRPEVPPRRCNGKHVGNPRLSGPGQGHPLAALGPVGEVLNPGQVYVTLSRLQRAGLVRSSQVEQSTAPDRKVYEVTAAGREQIAAWLLDSARPKVAPVTFHLKLVAAATTGLADPVALIDAQRRELLRQLREVQRLPSAQPDSDRDGVLLLEGTALRLQADVRWLEACERRWTTETTGLPGDVAEIRPPRRVGRDGQVGLVAH
jgi:DNA-binding PadR family transcriptional regulator